MKKFTYIIIALILLISLTTINVLAGNIDKAKIGQKMFESNIKSGEIVINNNEDDSFKELDAIIGDCEITDQEMSGVVGEVGHASVFTFGTGNKLQTMYFMYTNKKCKKEKLTMQKIIADYLSGTIITTIRIGIEIGNEYGSIKTGYLGPFNANKHKKK